MPITRRTRGSALLTVLWLSAALAAIAFALASTVRSETERASTSLDGTRSYYLAAGALDRASLELLWSARNRGAGPIPAGATRVNYEFPSGTAEVEIIPEAAKLNVNSAPPGELYNLGLALGLDAARAREIAEAIDDWRRPAESSAFDPYYLSLTPSFRAPHASFQEIEELMQVKGITPELFYGAYIPEQDGEGRTRLVRRAGLAECLSIYALGGVDVNTAAPAVMAAVGMTPDAIQAVMEHRRISPITAQELALLQASLGNSAGRLRIGGNSIMTLRATARIRTGDGRLSDLRRTVAAQVKYMPAGYEPIRILRWYDSAWSN